MVYPRISKDIPCISSLTDIHGISKYIPGIYQAYEGGLHIRRIYQAYSRHIPEIGVPDAMNLNSHTTVGLAARAIAARLGAARCRLGPLRL
jgi:hypothetical protein